LLASPAAALTQDDVLSATLLPGWRGGDGQHMAALALTLAPGWKTYWRSPGEAGIPPMLDFSGSGNLRAVRLHWPRPSVFDINGLQTIGYHDRLILPVEVTPIERDGPVVLRVTVDLGVCKDICLPAALDLTITLPPQGADDPAIRAALSDRPMAARAAGLTAITCAVSPIADGLRIETQIRMPSAGGTEALVIEATDPSIWVSQSTLSRDGAVLTAQTDLVPRTGAPFALDRSSLTVTVIGRNRAVEVTGCPAP